MENSILTPFQRQVLRTMFDAGLRRQGYYLTGGTALAEFYLRHRLSDDLDIFTRGERNIINDFEALRPRLTEINLTLDIQHISQQHLTVFLQPGGTGNPLKFEMARDLPPVRMAPPLLRQGIVIDSFEDIAVNKVCTILSRTEPKDACDLYFILKESHFTLEYLLDRAREKELQFETEEGKLLFAANLLDIIKLETLPRMIKQVSTDDLRQYLTGLAQGLFLRMRPRQ